MNIKIVNKSPHPIPAYSTVLSAGMDLRAFLPTESKTIAPGERVFVPTGLHIALLSGFEAQVRPRSGLALKHGVSVLNSPGTVDADYRGDIGVILINHGNAPFEITDGERIAQLVIAKYERIIWVETDILDETGRGAAGFGSTGVK